MIKLFQKTETEKYIIIKILFIKITFKKKSPKSDIDAIVWWIPFRSLRNAIRNIYYEYFNRINEIADNNSNILYLKRYIEYLEGILKILVEHDLLEGVKGKGGGYRLTKPAADYTLGEILRLTEGDLTSVSCTSLSTGPCANIATCPTHPVWQKLDAIINDYLDGVTLDQLL